MGLGLPDGGHLTHGFYTAKKKISASSIYFQSFPYGVDPKTKLIDYDGLEKTAKVYKPRIVICGASAYPRDWDYPRLRKIADEQGAYLMMDVSHVFHLSRSIPLIVTPRWPTSRAWSPAKPRTTRSPTATWSPPPRTRRSAGPEPA